jgi:acyl carrier protein
VKPHGIFTLDFKEDQAGRPKLTEINVRHVAFNSSLAAGGANLPADTLELLQLSDTSSAERIDYTFQQPMIFLRDVDGEPIVMPEAALLGAEQDYSLSTRTSTVSDKANGAAPIQMLMGLLNSILETSCRPALDHLQPQDRLQEDLGFDSLELAELTVRLEAETGVDVFRDGVVRTVGEILAKLNP